MWLKNIFLIWTTFKVVIEFVSILLLFCVLIFFFLARRQVGSQLPAQGLNLLLPALAGPVLTAEPPGRSQENIFFPGYCVMLVASEEK